MPSTHTHGKNTPFTLVADNRTTFTPCNCGVALTNSGRMAPTLARKLATGEMLVTTPRQATGAYGDRTGGIVEKIKPTANMLTLEEQLELDPRSDWTFEQRMSLFNAIVAQYVKG